ncbi:hypothetical protein N7478_000664 [Penicillium angulare]|uniref:uncharacterized protein n=1 Tax=Penicillium angulare TaxID=116970 RepID=UPI0025419F83|nr:uncharacterized protein N7478_000664 [Penicillium angulare]KAJ5291413.1 hypothetical protein N7478_000664 [Penicillium angulare]
MSTSDQSLQDDDQKEQIGPPSKKRRIIDTIISDSDGTIEDHQLCDYLIDSNWEANERLRSKLKDARVKLSTVERDFDSLEATHAQCPYWIQKNEHLVVMLEDHCESLEQDKKKLEERCDWLETQLRNHTFSPRENNRIIHRIGVGHGLEKA